MARPITVVLDANTTAAVDGVDKTTDSVTGLADALEETASQGGQSVGKLEGDIQELGDTASEVSQEAGRDLGDNVSKGAEKAGRSVGDFKEGAKGAFEDVGASVGDLAKGTGDVGDVAQSATQLLAGFGIAGVIAGGLAQGAIALVTKSVEDQQKELEELRQKFSAAYKEAIQDGRAYLNETQIMSGVLDDLLDPEKKNKATADAEALHVSLITLLRAENGDTKALNETRAAGTKALRDQYAAEGEISHGRADQNRGLTEQDTKLRGILDTLNKTGEVQQNAADSARLYSEYTASAAVDAAKVRSSLATIPTKKTVTVDVDDRDLDSKLSKPRNITLRVNQVVARNGQRYV